MCVVYSIYIWMSDSLPIHHISLEEGYPPAFDRLCIINGIVFLLERDWFPRKVVLAKRGACAKVWTTLGLKPRLNRSSFW